MTKEQYQKLKLKNRLEAVLISLIAGLLIFLASSSLFSCNSTVKFVPKTDTGVVAFWATKRVNPQMYVATWTLRRRLLPVAGDSTRNEFSIDTAFMVKISDTTSDGHGGQILDTAKHSIPIWISVQDSLVKFIHIVPTPKQ